MAYHEKGALFSEKKAPAGMPIRNPWLILKKQNAHNGPMGPYISYGFPMDFLWISYGFPMDYLWISYSFPMYFLCFGRPEVVPPLNELGGGRGGQNESAPRRTTTNR